MVLTCTALACAERIYPLYESLYVQRRDNALSNSESLSPEEKHRCGYTASLELLQELQRLGVYREVRETYQRLAIRNCIGDLDKSFNSLDIFKRDYRFLQSEGAKNLDLENILLSVLYHAPDQDIEKFASIQNGTPLDEFFYTMLCYEKEAHEKTLKEKNDAQRKAKEALAKINTLTKRINTLENTKSYRAIRFLYTVSSKLKQKLTGHTTEKQIMTDHPAEKQSRARPKDPSGTVSAKKDRRAAAQKRIAFLAFENFHFEVLSNMIRICNPEKNYITAYVHPYAKEEASKLLGSTSALVEWHDFDHLGGAERSAIHSGNVYKTRTK